MPAAANRHQQLLLAPKFHRSHHVRHVRAPRNHSRPPLNHRVVHLARRVVTRIPGLDQLPVQTGSKSRNRHVVHHPALPRSSITILNSCLAATSYSSLASHTIFPTSARTAPTTTGTGTLAPLVGSGTKKLEFK